MNKEDNKIKYEQWHSDPSNWKLGIFYFNAEDPRILPPKRIKQLGWTLNFGRWQAWIIIISLFIIVVYLINYI